MHEPGIGMHVNVNFLLRKVIHPGHLALGFIVPAYDFALLHMWRTFDLAQFPNVRPVCWPTVDPGDGQQVTECTIGSS